MQSRVWNRMRRRSALTALVVVVVALTAGTLAGCSDDDSAAPATTVAGGETTSTSQAAPATTEAPATTAAPTTTQPEPPVADECDPEAIDAYIRAMFGASDAPEIDHVDVTHCAGGYARVIVVPVESNFESEQVFLQRVDDSWETLDFGTGISCGDDDLPADLAAACAALGIEE